MQFDNSFSVRAPIADVYAAVGDIERVVSCVPGARVLERPSPGTFEVALKAQLGVVWRTFYGTLTVLARDRDAHRVVLRNRARNARGKPVGEARIEIALAELGAHTNVSIYSRVSIVDGMLAEKTIHEGSAKQMREFSAALRAMVAG